MPRPGGRSWPSGFSDSKTAGGRGAVGGEVAGRGSRTNRRGLGAVVRNWSLFRPEQLGMHWSEGD